MKALFCWNSEILIRLVQQVKCKSGMVGSLKSTLALFWEQPWETSQGWHRGFTDIVQLADAIFSFEIELKLDPEQKTILVPTVLSIFLLHLWWCADTFFVPKLPPPPPPPPPPHPKCDLFLQLWCDRHREWGGLQGNRADDVGPHPEKLLPPSLSCVLVSEWLAQLCVG